MLITWSLWTALCWIVIGVLIAPVVPGGWLSVAALALLGATPILALVRGFGRRVYPSAATRVFVIRPFWYLQLLLPLVAALGLTGAIGGAIFGAAGAAGRAAVAFGATLFAIVMGLGYLGSRRLVVVRRELRVDRLPDALHGLRIVQISDLHVGPHTSRRFLARIARAVREADPEIVAITGDQVDDFAQDMPHFASAFGGLRAPLGVHVVPGNHDVYAGWSDVRRALEALPITVLVNDAVPRERDGTRMWVAGTGDPAGHYWSRDGGADAAPDIARTLARVPAGEFVLVLAHNPALWPALAERGVPVTLSGHTHHGQLAIPSLGWSLVSPFVEHAMGIYERNGAVLYVHPGTNYWGIPFRLGAPPEVTILTLVRHPDFHTPG